MFMQSSKKKIESLSRTSEPKTRYKLRAKCSKGKNDWALTFSAYKKIRGEEAKEFTKESEVELKAFLTMGTANGNFLETGKQENGYV